MEGVILIEGMPAMTRESVDTRWRKRFFRGRRRHAVQR
jgi:hypothetical protein